MSKQSRRKFLIDSISTLGLIMMPFPRSLFANAAETMKTGPRQHLINIIDLEGWDSYWFFNAYDGVTNPCRALPNGWSDTDTNLVNKKVRYHSQDTITPTGMNLNGIPSIASKMGPGMKNWTSTDFSRLCLWRGIKASGNHGVNNHFYAGGGSPYFASYSALIASHQAATRQPRLLHYVKISDKSGSLFTGAGMLSGYAIASCVPDQKAWKTLTSRASTQIDPLENAITRLSNAAKSRLNRESSLNLVKNYNFNYESSKTLAMSQYATELTSSDAFLKIWMRYFKVIHAEAVSQQSSGMGATSAASYTVNGKSEIFYTLATEINEQLGLLTSYSFSDTDYASLQNFTGNSTVIKAKEIAWKFALAAFLVIKDLSAVVDFNPTFGDFHGDGNIGTYKANARDAVDRLYMVTAMRELSRHLCEYDSNGVKLASPYTGTGAGNTLLSKTLITCSSDFDRTGEFHADTLEGFGTNHNATNTMVLMGHQSNMGNIFGSIAYTTNLQAAAKSLTIDPVIVQTVSPPSDGDEPSFTLGAVPINFNTGILEANGSLASVYHASPSILNLFDCPLPIQQKTESGALPFLKKKS